MEVDKKVLATGKPSFLNEKVDKSDHGRAILNVCKFLGEFEGETRVFGVSFVIGE